MKSERVAGFDGRSAEGREIKDWIAKLTAQVGGTPTASQTILIERIAVLAQRLAEADKLSKKFGIDFQSDLGWLRSTATLATLLVQLDMTIVARSFANGNERNAMNGTGAALGKRTANDAA